MLSSIDWAKWYRKEKRNQGYKDYLTEKEYRSLEDDMVEFIQHRIIEEQKVFTFPEKIGLFYIKASFSQLFRSRVRYRIIDNVVKGKRRRYTNAHTFGWYFKFYWRRNAGPYLVHKTWYNFFPAAGNKTGQGKRRLSKFLFDQNTNKDLIIIRK